MKKRLFTWILMLIMLFSCAWSQAAAGDWYLEPVKDKSGKDTGDQQIVCPVSGKNSMGQAFTGTVSCNADVWHIKIRDAADAPVSFAPKSAGKYSVSLNIGTLTFTDFVMDRVSYGEEVTLLIDANDLSYLADGLLRGQNAVVSLEGERSPSYTFTVKSAGYAEAWFKRASAFMEKKEYARAKEEFAVLARYGHPGASEQVQACEDGIHSSDYEAAVKLFNDGKYEEAKAAFASFGAYKDSAEMVNECSYQMAEALYAQGAYAKAAGLYAAAGDHKDAKTLLSTDEKLKNQIWPGKTVTLGEWGREAIEWQVLEVKKDGTCVLLSVKGLDVKPYNTKGKSVTWETCSLRKWLNGDFYKKAFSADEKKKIQLTSVKTPKNTKYGTKGGKTAKDRVYLLSLDEVSRYFRVDPTAAKMEDRSAEALICLPTQTAAENGANTVDRAWIDRYRAEYGYPLKEGACPWWLRSSGASQSYAAIVQSDGYVSDIGCTVDEAGACVRPVVCARL